MRKPVRKAVFPVAGLGTRFLPATKAIPKEMLTLVDRPLIQYAVDEARAAGIEEFVFVTSHGKQSLEDHFDTLHELNHALEIKGKFAELEAVKSCEIGAGHLYFTRQHTPLGLGHAIWCARHIIGTDPFAVILPDEVVLGAKPPLVTIMNAYRKVGGNVIGVTEVPDEQTFRYGIVAPGEDNGQTVEITAMIEKPQVEKAPSNLAITGPYILQSEVFDYLEQHRLGSGGEIQLTDAIASLIGKQPMHGCRYGGQRFDCGNKHGFVAANIAFALARADLAPTLRPLVEKLLQSIVTEEG
ncbi:MAG: UTP--glucose-1-phosphate uridylyltransferase [Pseudomonadota bacterium]|nr:UTP--glucose-1-phosphate uridylyltransferase [Pseudomonadota bacterium]